MASSRDCAAVNMLVEVLDPAKQREYAQGVKMQNWRTMFGLG